MTAQSYYTGLKGFYFRKLLRTLVAVGDLQHKRVLDFGCGTQELRRMLLHTNYVGYDVRPELSDVPSPEGVLFDVMVANEVFYEIPESEIENILATIQPQTMVVGISKQNIFNKIGAALLHPGAHDKTITPPGKEIEILTRRYRVVARTNVWFLADVYLLVRK